MKKPQTEKSIGAFPPCEKPRDMKEYYSVLIKLIADAAPKKSNAGSGNAPEDPSLEHGKVR